MDKQEILEKYETALDTLKTTLGKLENTLNSTNSILNNLISNIEYGVNTGKNDYILEAIDETSPFNK